MVSALALFGGSIAQLSSMRDTVERLVIIMRDQLTGPAACGLLVPIGPLKTLLLQAVVMKLLVGALLLLIGIALPSPRGTGTFARRSAL